MDGVGDGIVGCGASVANGAGPGVSAGFSELWDASTGCAGGWIAGVARSGVSAIRGGNPAARRERLR